MKNYNTMLHMKLNSAVSVFSIAAAFAVFLPPSNASAVRRKAIPTILPANARNIMPNSEHVPVMTII